MKTLLSPFFGLQTYSPTNAQATTSFSSKPPLFSGVDTLSFSARPSVLFGSQAVANTLNQGALNASQEMKSVAIHGYDNLGIGIHPDAKVKINGLETKLSEEDVIITSKGQNLEITLKHPPYTNKQIREEQKVNPKVTITNANQAPGSVVVLGSDGVTLTVVAKNDKANTLNLMQSGKLTFENGASFEVEQTIDPSLAILPAEKTNYPAIQKQQLNPIYNVGINFFIPSAGLGSRLFPFTYTYAKPALPWNGAQGLVGATLTHLSKVFQKSFSSQAPMKVFVNLLAGKDTVRNAVDNTLQQEKLHNIQVHYLDESREILPGGTASFLGKALLGKPEPYPTGFEDKQGNIVDVNANKATLKAFGDFSEWKKLEKKPFFFSMQGDGFVTADFMQFMNNSAKYFTNEQSPSGAIVLGYKDNQRDPIPDMKPFGSFNLKDTGEIDKFHEKVAYTEGTGNRCLNAGYYLMDAKAQHYVRSLYNAMIEKNNKEIFDPAKKDKFDFALHIFTPLSGTELWKKNAQGQYLDKDDNVIDEALRIPANGKHTKAFVEFIEKFRTDYENTYGGKPKLYGTYQDGAYVDVGSAEAYYSARQKVLNNETPLSVTKQDTHLFFDNTTGMQFAQRDLENRYQVGIDRDKTNGKIIVFPLDNASAN